MICRLIVVCNALDDKTREERGIFSDSPAATHKILAMCHAIRSSNARPFIVSLGRGNYDCSMKYYSSHVRRIDGIPIIYLPFLKIPILSELLSLVAPVAVFIRFYKRKGVRATIFYNRLAAYFFALITSVLLKFRTFLDLEDGEVLKSHNFILRIASSFKRKVFDLACSDGSLLACSSLRRMTSIRPVACYYGCVPTSSSDVNWGARQFRVLFSGTISRDTGSLILQEAIARLRADNLTWTRQIVIEISGKGDEYASFSKFSETPGFPAVVLHGRLTDSQYQELVSSCHVGLALKPIDGPLADTTFPSKVVEFAGLGLLVLTTEISDVKAVLSESGALFLNKNDPDELIKLLEWIVLNRRDSSLIAKAGRKSVIQKCSLESASNLLITFLFHSE